MGRPPMKLWAWRASYTDIRDALLLQYPLGEPTSTSGLARVFQPLPPREDYQVAMVSDPKSYHRLICDRLKSQAPKILAEGG